MQQFQVALTYTAPQAQGLGQRGDTYLGGIGIRRLDNQLQLGERAEAFDLVERDFHPAALPIDVGLATRLPHLAGGRKPQGAEQAGPRLDRCFAGRQRQVDLVAGFRGRIDLRALVGEEVRLAFAANAQGLVGVGEIAGRMGEVNVKLRLGL